MSLQEAILPAIARFAKDIPLPTAGDAPSILATALAAATTLATAATTIPTGAATAPPNPMHPMAPPHPPPPHGGPHDGPSGGECRLLGPFALIVQLALGGLALMSLVYKRWRERPQRPVKIWFFDVSKQVFGSVLVHMANVFMSMLTSGRLSIKLDPPATAAAEVTGRLLSRGHDGDKGYVPNPCSWYLLNLGIDTTLGIPILILLLRVTTKLVAHTPLGQPPESIQSGNYGSPPKALWWLKQSIIYFCGLFGMKVCVLIIFVLFPWISHVGDWALGWTEGNERLQIVFVMMLFPLIMNAMQYYIIDSFIKKQTGAATDEDDGDCGDAGRTQRGHLRRSSSSGTHGSYDAPGESADEEELVEREGRHRTSGNRQSGAPAGPASAKPAGGRARREYDPDVDGDERTIIGSSTSSRQTEALLSKDLLPRE
ncbi:hypothetical protein GGTG_01603 [Gaeumannomyces tritici R3-111a-1]|uniref:Vacuolar membrane protein n=1 Tax=Gaeumannomyces tritici (strain R3-111a-1) TaxID=644352 RepID=J3NK21_GAET3|nr:hypothetical protein GGTG_01603 [Gaeumannomyces tritici R3-111a-1]EJT81625.1 hypothetical protein GGTG_01603 [Gaeumannomyces tritici R3-111a-1]